jgi:hypothetical protein
MLNLRTLDSLIEITFREPDSSELILSKLILIEPLFAGLRDLPATIAIGCKTAGDGVL